MLKDEEDAFGHEMYDFYQGKEVWEIIERDDGYIDVSLGAQRYFSEFEDWYDNEKEAMYYVEGKVLDIGCGAGRHSLYLQKNDFDVLGIDNSPLAIKVCKLRGLKKAKILSLHEIEPDLGKFDTILMLGNNFALTGNPQNARRTLKTFLEITSDNGRIIAEFLDPYSTDNEDHLEYHKLNRQRGRMGGQGIIRVRYKKYISPWFDFLLLSREELKELLTNTGWKIEELVEKNKQNPSYIAIIKKIK
jgi:SAM-dependent methyltransferase